MEENKVDATALASALRTLGIFYGAERPLADVIAGAADEGEAIRAYIQAERPHLLTCYDMEALITLIHEDAVMTMPPLNMWIRGNADITAWMVEPTPSQRGSSTRSLPSSRSRANVFASACMVRPGPRS